MSFLAYIYCTQRTISPTQTKSSKSETAQPFGSLFSRLTYPPLRKEVTSALPIRSFSEPGEDLSRSPVTRIVEEKERESLCKRTQKQFQLSLSLVDPSHSLFLFALDISSREDYTIYTYIYVPTTTTTLVRQRRSDATTAAAAPHWHRTNRVLSSLSRP